MENKKYFLILVFILSLVTLSACGGSVNEKVTTDRGKQELTIATWANEREAKEFDNILAKLNNDQTKYKLKQVVIPKDYYTKIQTMIAGDNAPDLLWLAQEYLPAYAHNGAIINLENKLNKQDKIDMTDYLNGSLHTAKYEDELYGLPWIGQPYVVYYNKTMLVENELPIPALDWSWSDFKDYGRQLTNDDVYGFASTGSIPLAVFAWGAGGEIIGTDRDVLLTDSKTIAGFQVAADLYADSEITMPYAEAEALGVEQGFVTGKVAMMIGGANDDIEKKVEEAGGKFEVGMAVMPKGTEQQVTFNWTASTVISEQTKDEDLAFDALLAVTEAMFDWKVPSPVASKVEQIATVNPYKAYAVDIISRSTEIARGFNNFPEQNELGGKQWTLLDVPIISNNNGKGDLDLASVVKKTAEQFKKILK